jgi:hypothetical protein
MGHPLPHAKDAAMTTWPADVQRITIVYEVVRLHRGAWVPLFTGTSRYAAMSAYNDSEPPKRMMAIGRTGGAILHESPESEHFNPAV